MCFRIKVFVVIRLLSFGRLQVVMISGAKSTNFVKTASFSIQCLLFIFSSLLVVPFRLIYEIIYLENYENKNKKYINEGCSIKTCSCANFYDISFDT